MGGGALIMGRTSPDSVLMLGYSDNEEDFGKGTWRDVDSLPGSPVSSLACGFPTTFSSNRKSGRELFLAYGSKRAADLKNIQPKLALINKQNTKENEETSRMFLQIRADQQQSPNRIDSRITSVFNQCGEGK